MFSKKYRLSKQKDFEKIFKAGQFINGQFIFLKNLKNKLEYSRFAFVVSSKISKKAVIRNKIKRRMRDIAQRCFQEIKPGYDIIITAKPGIDSVDYNKINQELIGLFKKASLINV